MQMSGAVMIIRSEEPADRSAIREVVRQAFAQAPHSSGTEPVIVDKLREKGALTLSLVAVEGAQIVGHIGVSPVIIAEAPGMWFGLGPVSVRPSRQGKGVGSSMVSEVSSAYVTDAQVVA